MRFLLILAFVLIHTFAGAQTPPDSLEGEAMRSWIRSNYYVNQHNTLGYNEARKKMYAFVDNMRDSMFCVYSSYNMPWPAGLEETFRPPFTTEHSVPRSLYDSEEPMFSDMHHLFPTYDDWNNLRSNFPFGEIPDDETTIWMYLDESQSTIPTENIDEYSEYRFGRFEPREEHKGDLARVMFYFFTVYPSFDINSVGQLSTFCQWHAADPVSQKELDRNRGIEFYQGNLNPFVEFEDLAAPAWGCPSVSTGIKEVVKDVRSMIVLPSDYSDRAVVLFDSKVSDTGTLEIFDTGGRRIYLENILIRPGKNQIEVRLADLQADVRASILLFTIVVRNKPYTRTYYWK